MALNIISTSPLSPFTKATYAGTLRLLADTLEFDLDSLSDLRSRLNRANESYEAIKERWPDPATRNRVLTCILAVVRYANLELAPTALSTWKHIHWVLTRNTSRRSGKLTPREAAAWVPLKEIIARREELGATQYGSMDHLFLCWYTMWPPNRADFFKTYIFDRESDVPGELRAWMHFKPPQHSTGTVNSREVNSVLSGGAARTLTLKRRDDRMPHVNFICLQPTTSRATPGSIQPAFVQEWDKSPRLVILSHKTAGSHGRLIRAIPGPLVDVLKASLELIPRNILFVRSDGKPFSSSHSFTVWGGRLLERLFNGRKLGFNGLRHSYISSVDYNRSSPSQLATLARDMGHSEYQQRRYARGDFKEGRDVAMKEGGARKRPRRF